MKTESLPREKWDTWDPTLISEVKRLLSIFDHFLASPDALEVILVTYSLPPSLSVSTDLTDVTLVSDDTY